MKSLKITINNPRRTGVILFCTLLFIALQCIAITIPDHPTGYVNDLAGMMSESARTVLEEYLSDYEQKSSTQIVVLTIPSLEGEVAEDVALQTATKWKIGQKGKDNGILLFIARDDRTIRIEVGYGLEGVLPDSLAGKIIRTVIVPQFRAGDVDAGVRQGVEAITAAIAGEFTADTQSSTLRIDPAAVRFFILVALALICVLLIIDILRYMHYQKTTGGYKGKYSFLEWFFLFSALLFLIKLIFQILYILALSRGGSTGGRGGFSSGGFSGGGGSFGGGGASGRW